MVLQRERKDAETITVTAGMIKNKRERKIVCQDAEKEAAKSRIEKKPKNKILAGIAKVLRVVSIPPLMVAALLLSLSVFGNHILLTAKDAIFSYLLLSGVSLLSSPISYAVPFLRKKGREGQRNLAFYMTAFGYICAVLYGVLFGVGRNLLAVYFTYLISVAVLLIFNKVLHIRASGHGCSVAGPILLICVFIGGWGILAGLLCYAAVFWASVYLGRHTVKEFLLGSVTSLAAFPIAYLVAMLIR